MFKIQTIIILSLLAFTNASFSGPYLMWGQEKLNDLRSPSLTEPCNKCLVEVFKDSKAVIIFLRNNTSRMGGEHFLKFRQYVKANSWMYFPQRSLEPEPFNYNTNVKVISLSGSAEYDDTAIINSFKDAVAIYGEGEVLGILAYCEQETHYLVKREDIENGYEALKTTPAQIPLPEESDKSKIYLADGKKAVLFVNEALVLNIANSNESLKLDEHNTAITFDDQKFKGYGRLNIIFNLDGEKIFLRFNFTLSGGSWRMKAVEVEYKEYKNVLPIVGDTYNVPMAPLGFSYRCSSFNLLFRNSSDSLIVTDYQIQPWLNGASSFGDVYDCIGFTTSGIWAGFLVSFFLLGILLISLIALMDIKTPNRFESLRSKQLTFSVQE